MAEFICRCCGGALEQVGESTLYICSYCGMKQTAPKFTDSQRRNLYIRAEQLRSGGEFDRAAALYEQITVEAPQNAELWWALLLCRYGVTYVLDGKKAVPSINRARRTSVLADELFKKACEFSQGEQLEFYRCQAQELDGIQTRLLAVSDQEQPFDVFICYKEDDGRGGRTYESLLAQDIYDRLTREGRRVFFSRVTLEDKPGAEYEPVIFSALNSARVMIAVGFTAEHFEAPWVRNEWSRFLSLMDGGRLMIPVFSGNIAAVPAELAVYQAVDAGQLGFMENIVSAVDRVLPQAGSVTTSAPAELLSKAQRCISNGEFTAADQLCEQLLDSDPENSGAYLVKLLAALHVRSVGEISGLARDVSAEPAWARSMRYADQTLAAELMENTRRAVQNWSEELCENSADPQELSAAAEKLERLGCNVPAEKCRARMAELLAERHEKEQKLTYDQACSILENSADPEELAMAENMFNSLGEYLDSTLLAERCRVRAEELRAESSRLAEEAQRQKDNRLNYLRRRRRIVLCSVVGTAAAAGLVFGGVTLTGHIIRTSEYSAGMADYDNGSYESAAEHFGRAGDYTDSQDMKLRSEYKLALQLRKDEHYDEAVEQFRKLGDYKHSAEEINKTLYQKACWLRSNGNYDDAILCFKSISGLEDSEEQIKSTQYMQAEALLESGELDKSAELFLALGDYSDSSERLSEIRYKNAEVLLQQEDYTAAEKMFELSQYGDWDDRVVQTQYLYAEHTAAEDKEKAAEMFGELGDYSDSRERSTELYYQAAEEALAKGDSDKAVELFTSLGSYSDSSERLTEAKYAMAQDYLEKGDPLRAANIFSVLGNYENSPELLEEARRQMSAMYIAGSTVEFGSWEQDGDLSSPEPIQWVVISNDGRTATLSSRFILDQRAYGGEDWKNSDLRSWLNGEFLNTAFTEEERGKIRAVQKDYWDYDGFHKLGTVSDYVSVPDYHDGLDKGYYDTVCSAYAESKRTGGARSDMYWLRSYGAGVPLLGSNGTATISNPYPTAGVLPVICINLK